MANPSCRLSEALLTERASGAYLIDDIAPCAKLSNAVAAQAVLPLQRLLSKRWGPS